MILRINRDSAYSSIASIYSIVGVDVYSVCIDSAEKSYISRFPGGILDGKRRLARKFNLAIEFRFNKVSIP